MRKILICIFCAMSIISCGRDYDKVDISGEWQVFLDSTDFMSPEILPEWGWNHIVLPGITDDVRLGNECSLLPALEKPQMLHLTRKHSYIGPAYYVRKVYIPESWKGKSLRLYLERVMWESRAWVNGIRVDTICNSLVSPHIYDLTSYLIPGKENELVIKVDNRKKFDISVHNLAHAYTEDTQIMWNGILGDMFIEACPKLEISGVNLNPDVHDKSVKVVLNVENRGVSAEDALVEITVIAGKNGRVIGEKIDSSVTVVPGKSEIELYYHIGDNAVLWDEFNPYVYELEARLVSADMGCKESILRETFGLREMSVDGNQILINGKPLFLRGTLECCVFPLTGTPPLDKIGWEKVFRAAKEYGLNHLRFHSWCPPEAAFEVADEMGFYLQIELPVWTLTLGEDAATVDWLRKEADNIIREYGNHPSFCLWSMGNELQGDFNVLSSLLREIKSKDLRHLYTTTSFTFEKGHGVCPEPEDDYFITQWTNNGWVRGQGVFNNRPPTFDKDYRAAMKDMSIPLVTHEMGQYSVYPDISEIDHYTGTLVPLNFMAVKEDLEKKGLLDKAADYLQASGKLAAILYKEEIERALKTPGISGFQLLDLHDFPGQGTALVGLLNAFWESKGIVAPEYFRGFCSPVVPLLRFEKAVYTSDEKFVAAIELSNYSDIELNGKTMKSEIVCNGELLYSSSVDMDNIIIGHNDSLGSIEYSLSGVSTASKAEITVYIEGTQFRNSWNIWIYPAAKSVNWGNVRYTRSYSEALGLLSDGENVLFNPDWHTIKGVEGKFVPVFWSPVHFPKQAGTMGVLCNPSHPALSDFPTDMHSDWQWWDLNINSTTLVVDSLKGGKPIVEMVDNFLNNRKLTLLYEGKVGNGKLMIATCDLNENLESRPVARQLLSSVLDYMNSTDFEPAYLEGFYEMGDIFGTVSNVKQSAEGIY